MYGEKRARQIEYKARKQRESLAGVSNTAPLNAQVRLRAYCMILFFMLGLYTHHMTKMVNGSEVRRNGKSSRASQIQIW